MNNDHVLRIALASFEPSLRAATDDLRTIVAVANEFHAKRIEPSHILLALSRIPGGMAASFLSEHRVPVDALTHALSRSETSEDGTTIDSIDEATASKATAGLFAALRQGVMRGGWITERSLLGETLVRLEPPVADRLRRFARIDAAQWGATTLKGQRPANLFIEPDGTLDLTIFSPRTKQVMETMAREAGALGCDRLSTILLLHTMAVTPNGLVESGLQFLQHDVKTVRSRLFTLVRGRTTPSTTEMPLQRSTMEPALVLALERAAVAAGDRGEAHILERDLLAAMLEAPAGVVASVLRDATIDVAEILRFAARYYQESQAPGANERMLSPEEAAEELRQRIVGQDQVVERLIPYLDIVMLSAELGYLREDRPAAALLFCGPSGTGKTMAARVLARILFGSEDAVLRFDMGQFNTRESINNFIGASPGYVGYGEGKLTNGLRDNARRVILFDEVEKADKRVFDALLRLLDDGRIDDPAGPVRDAREAVIVLTSNLGGQELSSGSHSQLDSNGDPRDDRARKERAAYRRMLGRFFRPEFLNRVDEVIVFAQFDEAGLRAIALAHLQRACDKLRRQLAVELTWSDEVPGHLAARAEALRPEEAARGVNRCADDLVLVVLRRIWQCRARNEAINRVRVTVNSDHLEVRPA